VFEIREVPLSNAKWNYFWWYKLLFYFFLVFIYSHIPKKSENCLKIK
jgi:hypothetical protein